MDKRVKIIDWLNLIEEEYDVTGLKVDDLHYWPVLRWELAKKFIKYQGGNSIPHNNNIFKEIIGKTGNIIRGGFYFILLKFKWIGNYKIIFSGSKSHYIKYDGEWINRFFFPMARILQRRNISVLTADYSGNLNQTYDNYPLILAFNFYNKISSHPKIDITSNIFNEIISRYQSDFQVPFDTGKFKNKLGTVFKWASLYEMLIDATKPKWIFSLCYYNPQVYALNLACFRRNIKSVEVQHGPQGALHPAYSGFAKIPESGFSILPKIFWCWDKTSTNYLRNIFGNNLYHKVFYGGHPWISYLMSQQENIKNKGKKTILFTLQTLKNVLPEIILEAIANTPDSFIWGVRLHPRMENEDINFLKKKLQPYINLGIVEIEDASKMPLPQILALSCVHITRSSGCFIEANMIGVPNIIVDDLGALYYKDFFDNERNFVQTQGDLWPLIIDVSHKNASQLEKVNLNDKLKYLFDTD